MKEQAVLFGPGTSMVGVLTEPDDAPRAPHLLILNAGFVHRAGPGRLAVELARQVADAGFSSLRIDLSGIGDSPARVPPLDPITCGIADARAAMDHLCLAHGARQFILVGLCSGARHGHNVTVADPRVVGAVMLDGWAFPTARSTLMAASDRLSDPLALLAGARRRLLRRLKAKPAPVVHEEEGDAFFPMSPTREEMARDLRALVARRVRLLYIFSGEWRVYRYTGQLRDAFRDVALESILSEKLIDHADHLYFTRPERTAMMGLVKSWLRERFC